MEALTCLVLASQQKGRKHDNRITDVFLCVAVLVLVNFLVPKRFQWVVLPMGSYAFYWSNRAWLLLALFGNSMITAQ